MLCPRCEAGTGSQKSKSKRAKDVAQCNKRSGTWLDCLSDVENALLESKDSASAVRAALTQSVWTCFFNQKQTIELTDLTSNIF